jgi:anti-sigma regulatory factor (Ser/Thr protein kinase)
VTTSRRDDSFGHPALFYRDDAEYLAAIRGFVREGAVLGEPMMVAAPSRNLELLRAFLGPEGDVVEFHDMSVAGRNPGRIIGDVLLDFVRRRPGRRARIVGEPIWAGRDATEYPACAQHEALINVAFEGVDATILCPYNVTDLDPVVVDDARRTHPTLWMDVCRWDSDEYVDPRLTAGTFNLPLEPEPDSATSMPVWPPNLDESRRFTAAAALAAGLTAARVGDAMLAVDELVSNTIKHGGGFGRLATWIDGSRLVFEVIDGGLITDPLAGRRRAAADQENGRGLAIVHRICDLVRVRTGPEGTATRAYFDLA